MRTACLQDIDEPHPRDGSALRYAHQNAQVMTREQYMACQRKHMAERPPADAIFEAGVPPILALILMGCVTRCAVPLH